MLHWNDLHPYNAVMVVRIPATLEPECLSKAIGGTLEAHGLTNLTLDRSRGTFDYQGGPVSCEIKTIATGENRQASLCAEIEAQLNTPFIHTGRFNPFRFFVMPEPDGFSLGVVYFHAIADAEAVVLLTRDMVEAYLNPTSSQLHSRNHPWHKSAGSVGPAGPPHPAFSPSGGEGARRAVEGVGRHSTSLVRSFLESSSQSIKPLNPYPPCRDGLLSHPGMLLKKLLSLPALIRDLRSSARRHCRDADDFSNRFTLFALAPEDLEALLKTAKAWNVTLNDLFLALLLKCFSRLESNRLSRPRRRKLSIGCIVNLRKDLGLAGQRVFGPFLGTFGVTHEMPDGIGLMELARDIRRQTLVIKRNRLYLGSTLELSFGRFIFSRSSPEQQKKFYPKNFPLWGGVTNVNLNPIWPQSSGEKPVDCLSTASTGPVIPLVFSVMTVRDIVNVALTWRPAFFSEADIAQLKKDFLDLVGSCR